MNQEKYTIFEKINNIKLKYKLEFSHFIDFPEDFLVQDMAVNNDNIYLSGKQLTLPPLGKIISLHTNNQNKILNILSDITLDAPAMKIAINTVSEDKLLYTEGINNISIIKSCSASKRNTEIFIDDSKVSFLQIPSIKTFKDKVFVSDFFRHKIFVFTIDGVLLFEKDFANEGFEFPLQIEIINNKEMYIFFNQNRGRIKWKKYAGSETLNDHFIIKWNYIDDNINLIELNLIADKNCMSVIRSKQNDFFIMQEDILIKYDKSLKKIFEINIADFLMDKANINKDDLKANELHGTLHKKLICTCNDNNLFVISPTTGFLRKIAVFKI